MKYFKVFTTPTSPLVLEDLMDLSAPVAFQKPFPAARFGLSPFKYFFSLGERKYHSFSVAAT